jgi:MFS family permease
MIRTRLSVMMFLEFFIWGAWLPLIFGYLPSLGFSPLQQSWILNAFALASFVGMFFSNQFADRNFAAERFLAVSQFIGGLAILGLYFVRPGWTIALGDYHLNVTFWAFFLLMLVHCLFYVPTISITNSILFANVSDPQRDFPLVRLWGTIGWIAASWPFVFILVDWAGVDAKLAATPEAEGFVGWLGAVLATPKTGLDLQAGVRWTFVAAGLASLLLAAFSLTLPHTPPRPAKAGESQFAWLEASKLLAIPFVFVLFLVTFVDAAVHQCYFIWTNDYLKSVGIPGNWVMPAMSIGQIAEIGTMAVLGFVLKSLGWRTTMVIGILGHAARFAAFALLPMPWLAVGVNVLHGICYAFFFATVYIFVDEFFPKDARSSAQGLFNFLILGVGPFVANFVWPFVGDAVRTVDVTPTVRYDQGAPTIVLEGFVKSAWTDGGQLTITGKGPDDAAVEQSAMLSGDELRAEFPDVKPGKYDLQFEVLRQHSLMEATPARVDIAVEVPTAEPKEPVAPPHFKVFDFEKLFMYPSATALLAALVLALFFRPPAMSSPESGKPVAPAH